MEGVRMVDVPGGRVWTRQVGAVGATPLVLLHGGPGCPSAYLEPFEAIGADRPVLFYDQLGCGESDRPDDPALWRIERFVRELEAVIDSLGRGAVHLLGHSWGSMLGIDYALAHPERVASLVLASPCLSMDRVRADMVGLKGGLPGAVHAMIARCEAEGTTQSGAYHAAALVFYRRHLCRLPVWPEPLVRAEAKWGWDVYHTMWGPAEFTPTGNLAGFEREDRLGELRCPVLYTCGRHDEITPESTAAYHARTPGAEMRVFEDSAHLPHLEEGPAYLETVRDFLARAEVPAHAA
jgi:proline-specific peptidase